MEQIMYATNRDTDEIMAVIGSAAGSLDADAK